MRHFTKFFTTIFLIIFIAPHAYTKGRDSGGGPGISVTEADGRVVVYSLDLIDFPKTTECEGSEDLEFDILTDPITKEAAHLAIEKIRLLEKDPKLTSFSESLITILSSQIKWRHCSLPLSTVPDHGRSLPANVKFTQIMKQEKGRIVKVYKQDVQRMPLIHLGAHIIHEVILSYFFLNLERDILKDFVQALVLKEDPKKAFNILKRSRHSGVQGHLRMLDRLEK